MTKILLINPPFYHTHPFAVIKEPLGIAYLAAVLEQNNYAVEIIDAVSGGPRKEGKKWRHGFSEQELRDKIKRSRADIVGITCPFSIRINSVLEVASLVKKINNKIVVVAGGIHSTIFPKETLENENIDFVIIGEGEKSFLELVKKIEARVPAGNFEIDGCAYKNNGIINVNPKKEFIKDLDNLPFPARHLLPMEFYLKNKSILYGLGDKGACSIITSRSCPNNCSFCSMYLSHGRGFRPRSAENVFEEIKFLVKRYGAKEFFIFDDNFTFDKNRVMKLCDLILKNNLKIDWNTPNGLHINTLDAELLSAMKKAGCKNICIAIESGDEYIRNEIIGKHVSTDKIIEVINVCRKINLSVIGFFIIGLPGETEKTFLNTIEFVRKANLDLIAVGFATPLPGTRLYDECLKNGYIKNFDADEFENNCELKSPIIETENFDKKILQKWERMIYFEFIKSHFYRLFINAIFLKNNFIKFNFIRRFIYDNFKIITKL